MTNNIYYDTIDLKIALSQLKDSLQKNIDDGMNEIHEQNSQ